MKHNRPSLIPGSLGVALMTERPELLEVAMNNLRRQAAEGELTGEKLEHVLNAIELLTYEFWDLRNSVLAENRLQAHLQESLGHLTRQVGAMRIIRERVLSSAEMGATPADIAQDALDQWKLDLAYED